MMDVPDDIDTYSDAYHRVRAIKDGAYIDGTVIGVRGYIPNGVSIGTHGIPDEMRFSLSVTVDEEDFFVMVLQGTQIVDFINEYEEILFAYADPEMNTNLCQIEYNPLYEISGEVEIRGVEGSVLAMEPDSVVAKFGPSEDMSGNVVRQTILHNCSSEDNVIRTTAYSSITEEGMLKIDVRVGGIVLTWEYTKPYDRDESTEYVIESIGGGEPKFIDGTTVGIVPATNAPKEAKSLNGWALVAEQDIEPTSSSTSVVSRIRSRLS